MTLIGPGGGGKTRLALPGATGGNLALARAAVLCGAGTFAEFQGDNAEARKLFEDAR